MFVRISKRELEAMDHEGIAGALEIIMSVTLKTGSLIFIELGFDGYDDDPRPITEIPLIAKWTTATHQKHPELLQCLTPGSMARYLVCLMPQSISMKWDGRLAVSSEDQLKTLQYSSICALLERLQGMGMTLDEADQALGLHATQNIRDALSGKILLGPGGHYSIESSEVADQMDESTPHRSRMKIIRPQK